MLKQDKESKKAAKGKKAADKKRLCKVGFNAARASTTSHCICVLQDPGNAHTATVLSACILNALRHDPNMSSLNASQVSTRAQHMIDDEAAEAGGKATTFSDLEDTSSSDDEEDE